MDRKFACYCIIAILLLSGCAVPTVVITQTLPPKPTATQTRTLQLTLTSQPTKTVTFEPTLTKTSTPRPTPIFLKECGTVTLGKPGTQSQYKTHPILVQGTAILCNEVFNPDPNGHGGPYTSLPIEQARLDLDTGRAGTEVADIWYYIGAGSMAFYGIFNTDTAFMVNWGISDHTREPTFDECKSLSVLLRNDNEPGYVCVITNAGHVSRVKVEDFDWTMIKISFITWKVVALTPTPHGGK